MKYLALAAVGVVGTLLAVSMMGQRPEQARHACAPAMTREVVQDAFEEVVARAPWMPPTAGTVAGERDATPVPLPAARPEGLALLVKWDLDPDVRRRWLFRGEGEILDLCGTPSLVHVTHGGVEVWTYDLQDRRLALSFHRGRLVDAR